MSDRPAVESGADLSVVDYGSRFVNFETWMKLDMAKNVVETAKLRPAVAMKALEESWSIATDIAEELTRRGTPFHQAHKLVGRLVMESLKDDKKPAEWTDEALRQFDPAFGTGFAKLMANPMEGLKTRDISGGTAPARVKSTITVARRTWQVTGQMIHLKRRQPSIR